MRVSLTLYTHVLLQHQATVAGGYWLPSTAVRCKLYAVACRATTSLVAQLWRTAASISGDAWPSCYDTCICTYTYMYMYVVCLNLADIRQLSHQMPHQIKLDRHADFASIAKEPVTNSNCNLWQQIFLHVHVNLHVFKCSCSQQAGL